MNSVPVDSMCSPTLTKCQARSKCIPTFVLDAMSSLQKVVFKCSPSSRKPAQVYTAARLGTCGGFLRWFPLDRSYPQILALPHDAAPPWRCRDGHGPNSTVAKPWFRILYPVNMQGSCMFLAGMQCGWAATAMDHPGPDLCEPGTACTKTDEDYRCTPLSRSPRSVPSTVSLLACVFLVVVAYLP